MSTVERLKSWAAHAFAIDHDQGDSFDDEERRLVDRLADFVVERRLTTPALMLLESGRPLNFVGSQLLVFLSPFVTMIFAAQEYDRFVRMLENRQSVDLLIESIERRENDRHN